MIDELLNINLICNSPLIAFESLKDKPRNFGFFSSTLPPKHITEDLTALRF